MLQADRLRLHKPEGHTQEQEVKRIERGIMVVQREPRVESPGGIQLIASTRFINVVGELLAFQVHTHQVAMREPEQGAHHFVDDTGVVIQ